MNLNHFEALVVLSQSDQEFSHYDKEASTVNYVMFLLRIVHKYMEEAESREESLTAAFVDTLGEVIFILTELEGDLCQSDDD